MKLRFIFQALFCLTPGFLYSQERPNILLIIADDLSTTVGVYGEQAIATPNMDAVAANGIYFKNAFCTASSCSPSRASVLTGRYPHQLKDGANLWGTLPAEFPTYVKMLEDAGYFTGKNGKGWGPGAEAYGGYTNNPAGKNFKSFDEFLRTVPKNSSFCFWLGSGDPHRPYDSMLTRRTDLDTSHLTVPAWLPDNPEVRKDLKDYLAEAKRFDKKVGEAIALLKANGLLDNTLIIIASDNGMPFPRAKATVYDSGSNIPLIMCWGNKLQKGKMYTELVSLVDIAPTIVEAAGIKRSPSFSGQSLLPLLLENKSSRRFDAVFIERERHANVRKNNVGYPVRAIRTRDFLYIRNLRPERWPAGDPELGNKSFGDIDAGYSKQLLVNNRHHPAFAIWVAASLEKRPAEELYILKDDSAQLINVAFDKKYAKIKKELSTRLDAWRKQTGDPLLDNSTEIFDSYPYYGGRKSESAGK